MIYWLQSLPQILMIVFVVGGCALGMVLGFWLCRGVLVRRKFSDAQIASSMTVVGVIATINSLLLAFSAVSVWESFNTADAGVTSEANTLGSLSRDLAIYGGPEALGARQILTDYGREVIDVEWPLLAKGKSSPKAWHLIDDFFVEIGRLKVDSPEKAVLLDEIWEQTNALVRHRRDRLHASQSEVPAILWVVVFMATGLTLLFMCVLPFSIFNSFLVGGIGAVIGLVFLFIVAMEHPFSGTQSVGPEPFHLMLENQKIWNRRAQEKAP